MASKDQNSVEGGETREQKLERAMSLFIESIHKPDHQLRGCAHNQHCYDELMQIRENVLVYVKSLRKHERKTGQSSND